MLFTIIIYNFILFGSTALLYYSEKCKKSFDRRILVFTAFLIVTLPAAFRYNLGYDYPAYVQIFDNNALDSHVELFWQYLISTLNKYGFSSDSFFIISAFITYGILFLAYPKKYSFIINFAYICWIYFDSFSLVRSSLALSIMFATIMWFANTRNYIFSIAIILLSSFLIHKSTILLVVVILTNYFKIDRIYSRWIKYIAIGILLLSPFSKQILIFFFSLPILEWIGYGYYSDHFHYSKAQEINSGLGVLIKVIYLTLPLILIKFYPQKKEGYYSFLSIILISIISLIFTLEMNIFSRIHSAFSIGYLLTLYLMFNKKILTKYLYFTITILLITFSLIIFEHGIITKTTDKCFNGKISPYISIFNKEDDTGVPWSYCEQLLWE